MDYVGDVFRRAEAAGEWIRFPVWVRERADKPMEQMELSHAEYDAIGAMLRVLRERGVDPKEAPCARDIAPPGVLTRLGFLFGRVRVPTGWRVGWRRFDRELIPRGLENAIPTARAWRILSREETLRVESRAAAAGVSLNSYLLWTFNQGVTPRLADTARLGFDLWMVPVNLRGPVRLARDTMNHASYLPVRLPEGCGPAEVHASIRVQLRRRAHWRAWFGAGMLRFLPRGWVEAWMRRYYRREGHAWIGVFSNFGEWRVPELPELEVAMAPVATKAQPLAVAVVRVNGRLSLALQAHPALSRDPREARSWLGTWLEALDRDPL